MIALAAAVGSIHISERTILALMLIAAVVAIAASRLRVPYTIALVVVGVGFGSSGAFEGVHLTGDLIFLVFLPPLLFEGAMNLDFTELRRRWVQVSVLALLGTVVAAAVLGVAFAAVLGMPARFAVLLAVIIAPTDPVSVLAVLKESGVSGGLRTLLESESIFNDALGFVLYVVAVDVAFPDGDSMSALGVLGKFATEIGVGIGAGVVVGLVAHRLMGTLDDHLVEITLSLVTAFGAFLLADEFGGSGLIGTVVAGLLIGNYGTDRSMTDDARVAVLEFWDAIVFLANSGIFLLIGLRFHPSRLTEAATARAAAVAVVAMLVGRAIISFGMLSPFVSAPGPDWRGPPVPSNWIPAIAWGGLRGTVPIALVLGLGENRFAGIDASAVVFAVVIFSLVVQGLTYRPLLGRLGLDTPRGPIPSAHAE